MFSYLQNKTKSVLFLIKNYDIWIHKILCFIESDFQGTIYFDIFDSCEFGKSPDSYEITSFT